MYRQVTLNASSSRKSRLTQAMAANRIARAYRLSKSRVPRPVYLRTKAELKEITAGIAANTNIPQSTLVNPRFITVSAIGAGTDIQARIGRKIEYKNMTINIAYSLPNGGANSAQNTVMWAVVLDRQPNGTLEPLFTDCFTVAGNLAPAMNFKSTLINQDRFQVLRTERFHIQAGDASNCFWHEYLDLTKLLRGRDRTENFNGTGATFTDINANAIYFVTVCCTNGEGGAAENAAGASIPRVSWMSKIRYSDV